MMRITYEKTASSLPVAKISDEIRVTCCATLMGATRMRLIDHGCDVARLCICYLVFVWDLGVKVLKCTQDLGLRTRFIGDAMGNILMTFRSGLSLVTHVEFEMRLSCCF